tara:strand:+ start:44 stop:496 length:453 start_codon:yes stop_codon:yes gene_type:complete
MGRSQESFSKKEKEKKKQKKREDKLRKRVDRKDNNLKGSGLDNMIGYVDELGNLTDTPPDPTLKKEIIKASSIVLGIPKKEHIEEDPIRKGKVDFYNDDKGFGFIIDAENNEKYFVHVSGLKQPISEGDKVTYELERGMKGMNAVRVSHI